MKNLVLFGLFSIYLYGCSNFKMDRAKYSCEQRSIILEIRKQPTTSSIDITEDYFLLAPSQIDSGASLSINNAEYDLHFLDLNAPHGVINCCLQSNFQENKNKEVEVSDLYFKEDEVFKSRNASYSTRYGEYRLRYYIMSDNEYCICSGNYSSTSQKVTQTTIYLTKRPQLIKCHHYGKELERLTSEILYLTEFAQ